MFKGADPRAVEDAIGDSPVVELRAGEVLLEIGQPNHCVYILLTGQLNAYLDRQIRPDQAIVISAGQVLGEISVIDGKPASAQVVAETDVRVLKLSREHFWDRLMTLPGIASNLALTLTERVRRTNEIAFAALREKLTLEHLRKELDAARALQTSMVPLQRPMFPDRHDLEVCGLMEPASSVGGDFFDAFLIDEDHLFVCIGDVSGHGIAAALFMARIVGLLPILVMNNSEPDQVLRSLNQRLCAGNDTNLFVTIFCGVLDTRSGILTYSNGGHCPPVLRSHSAGTQMLTLPRGPLIGAFPEAKFSSLGVKLEVGDVLLCYSDGVTEACNGAGEEYSAKRCVQTLENSRSMGLFETLEQVVFDAVVFCGSKTFEDDCTLLAVRRVG
jgi:sigma-B regulation protein RsbU (phosphoserine phosphatase)